MPTFRYDKLTATSYRVSDAHTGEAYGVIYAGLCAVEGASSSIPTYSTVTHPQTLEWLTRGEAAQALYTARHALGFEAGAL